MQNFSNLDILRLHSPKERPRQDQESSQHSPTKNWDTCSSVILFILNPKKTPSKVNAASLSLIVNTVLITNRKLRQRPCHAFVYRQGQAAFPCRLSERQSFAFSTLQRVYDLRTHMPLVVTTTTILFS